jgi:hypothetical protein
MNTYFLENKLSNIKCLRHCNQNALDSMVQLATVMLMSQDNKKFQSHQLFKYDALLSQKYLVTMK